mmetsp:Transcript_18019/g.43292  ORF Transcript_18019/g.43292 Transcript_18019/m.43292 type:complete len:234 (+) Transcript_18019:1401-2102(+)
MLQPGTSSKYRAARVEHIIEIRVYHDAMTSQRGHQQFGIIHGILLHGAHVQSLHPLLRGGPARVILVIADSQTERIPDQMDDFDTDPAALRPRRCAAAAAARCCCCSAEELLRQDAHVAKEVGRGLHVQHAPSQFHAGTVGSRIVISLRQRIVSDAIEGRDGGVVLDECSETVGDFVPRFVILDDEVVVGTGVVVVAAVVMRIGVSVGGCDGDGWQQPVHPIMFIIIVCVRSG